MNQIKTEVRLCIDSLNEYDNEKAQILDKYKDINLEELLAWYWILLSTFYYFEILKNKVFMKDLF